jgi:hypothetical protein
MQKTVMLIKPMKMATPHLSLLVMILLGIKSAVRLMMIWSGSWIWKIQIHTNKSVSYRADMLALQKTKRMGKLEQVSQSDMQRTILPHGDYAIHK